MSRNSKARQCLAHLGMTKNQGMSAVQAIVILCIGVAAMEAILRMDNSSWLATNAAVLRPAYELVSEAPAVPWNDVATVVSPRRSSAGAL